MQSLNEPDRHQSNPRDRTADQVLRAIHVNLSWSLDCAEQRLKRLKPGSSAFKLQQGYRNGLFDAVGVIKSEWGQA
jgi:hypothetical protein